MRADPSHFATPRHITFQHMNSSNPAHRGQNQKLATPGHNFSSNAIRREEGKGNDCSNSTNDSHSTSADSEFSVSYQVHPLRIIVLFSFLQY
jgi:hypothetical protein